MCAVSPRPPRPVLSVFAGRVSQDRLSEHITWRLVDSGSPPLDRTYHLSLAPQPTHMQYVILPGLSPSRSGFAAETVMQEAREKADAAGNNNGPVDRLS